MRKLHFLMQSLLFGFSAALLFFNISAHGYTINSSHPRLLVNANTLPAVINEFVRDGDMEDADCALWADQGTPFLKEKADFDGSRRMHIIGNNGSGVLQYINLSTGVEYEYSVKVYLVSGHCKGQIAQTGNGKNIFDFTSPAGEWQTFTGTYTPTAGSNLMIRFYGYDSGGNSEFYVDDVSIKRMSDRIVDRNMEYPDCTFWANQGTPGVKEKIAFGSGNSLHIVGNYGSGAGQYLNVNANQEYEYSVKVYLVSGHCKGQIYQDGGNAKDIFDFTSPTGGWQTFTGTYIPQNGPLFIRFYGYDSGGNSEFYVDDVSFKLSGDRIFDKNMQAADCTFWANQGTPIVKEKVAFGSGNSLHIVGSYASGVLQYINFSRPGVEYQYSVKVYLVSGHCKGQIAQTGNGKDIFDFTSPTGGWQTFTGTYTPTAGSNLMIRFYGYDSGGNSEFYIDDVSFKASDGVKDSAPFDLGVLYSYAATLENNGNPNPSPTTLASGEKMVAEVRGVAFVAMVTHEQRFIDLAIAYALAIAAKNASDGDDEAQRQRLLSMAYAFDFLHDCLTSQQKETLRASMVAHVRYLDSAYSYLSAPTASGGYTGGHSRYANVVALGALLALYNEYGGDATYCNNMLTTVVNNWVNGYNAFQGWVAAAGGYHMGWGYGPGYTDVEAYLFWKSAAPAETQWGETTWRKELANFYIYGLRGDQTMPAAGDAFDMTINEVAQPICVISALLGNQYAADFVRSRNLCSDGPGYIWRYIYMNDNNSSPVINAVSSLSLAKSFDNSGYVIARDKWNDQNATHLTFKCTPFYTMNHHHKDQNSIVLHYKGPLLIDSGSYDAYGSSHWENYFTRTIAHNSMVVYDPSETFLYYSIPVSNDGGQKFADYSASPTGYEPATLADITGYPKYYYKYATPNGGITAFSQTSTSCNMKGDASKAYNSSKVTTYTREVTMTYASSLNNNKPLINIKDHIVLASGKQTLIPRILFHSIAEPTFNASGKWIEITNANGGKVRIEVVTPATVNMTKIGGSGSEFLVNGTNYPPTTFAQTEPGAWRMEVLSTSSGNVDFEFNLKIMN